MAPSWVLYGDLSLLNRRSRFIRNSRNGWYFSGSDSSSSVIGCFTSRSKMSEWAFQKSRELSSSRSWKKRVALARNPLLLAMVTSLHHPAR